MLLDVKQLHLTIENKVPLSYSRKKKSFMMFDIFAIVTEQELQNYGILKPVSSIALLLYLSLLALLLDYLTNLKQ